MKNQDSVKGPKLWRKHDTNKIYVPRGLDRGDETIRKAKSLSCHSKQ